MASGDTKTEALLNILGNGGTGDEYRGSGNTKTQNYILDAIDRINSLDPGGGGSGDAARILSTDDYNYNMASGSATEPYDCVALWLLPAGTYDVPSDNVNAYYANTSLYRAYKGLYLVGEGSAYGRTILELNYYYSPSITYFARFHRIKANGGAGSTINICPLANETGSSQMYAMTQKAVTDTINTRLDNLTLLKISQTDYDNLQTKDANTLYIITGA